MEPYQNMCVTLRTGLQAQVSGKARQKFRDGWHYQICSQERTFGLLCRKMEAGGILEITQARGDDGGLTLRTSTIEKNGLNWQIIGLLSPQESCFLMKYLYRETPLNPLPSHTCSLKRLDNVPALVLLEFRSLAV